MPFFPTLFINSSVPAVKYKAFDNHGASDGVNLILGTPTNATPITIGSLTLSDLSNNGIGTLNVIAYDTVPFAHHTITTLNDLGLTSLTVSGTGDLAIGAFTDNVKTLTLTDNSTSTYGLSFTSSLTAPNLTTLNLAGSDSAAGSIYIGSLVLGTQTAFTINNSFASLSYIGCNTGSPAPYLTTLTLNNTGTGSLGFYNAYTPYQHNLLTPGGTPANLVAVELPALSTLNLNGGAIGINVIGDQVTTGITVNGGTANGDTPDGGIRGILFATAAIGDIAGDAVTGGAALNYTDKITLGNGTNLVQDNGLGNVNITLGSGSNTVVVNTASTIVQGTASQTTAASIVSTATPASAESGHDNITFAAHTLATADTVFVGYAQTAGTSPAGFAVITGLNSSSTGSDAIVFAADPLATGAVNQLPAFGGFGISLAFAETAASLHHHQIEAFAYGGNTWLVENSGTHTTIVELIGTTVTHNSSAAAGVLALHG